MLSETQRLTERNPKTGLPDLKYRDGLACRTFWFCPEAGEPCHVHRCDVAIAIERLASYEDTRLTPNEVMLLKKKSHK